MNIDRCAVGAETSNPVGGDVDVDVEVRSSGVTDGCSVGRGVGCSVGGNVGGNVRGRIIIDGIPVGSSDRVDVGSPVVNDGIGVG